MRCQVISTPELKKHYDQLVGSRDQVWSPKLETIAEYKGGLLLSTGEWIPPAAGSLKINCGASWSKGPNKGWGGIILRNSHGNLIDGRRFRILATSALHAEAFVIREACLFAKALNLSSVCIENDNAQLISLSVSELVLPWEVLAILSDIRLLAKDEGLSFRWTPREGNEAAHWVASSQASSLGPNWMGYPPEILYSILCKDFP
ncbi:hypothetical protein C3L33_05934, partial [Rhododendron williamsianum]